MRTFYRLIALAVTLVGAYDARAASAADRGENQLFEGKFSEAVTSFRSCLENDGDPSCAFNLSVALRGVGDYIGAKRTLRALLEGRWGKVPTQWRKQAKSLLRETTRSVASLTLQVSGDAASLTAALNDSEFFSGAPNEITALELNPGNYKLRIEANLYQTIERSIELSLGESMSLDVELKLDRESLISTLTVSGTSATDRVEIVGHQQGIGSVSRDLLPGTYRVRVSRGSRIAEERVVLEPGERVRVELDPERDSSALSSPWFWVGTGALAVGASVASYFILRGDEAPPPITDGRIGVIEVP
ncbi:MAG: hypothetical protein AAFQ82_09400 [Myxococcota bacterium]